MYGLKEAPTRSVNTHLETVDYPATPADIASAAADGEAPPEVVNLLRCLPRPLYARSEDVLRDLSEAARRFAGGPHLYTDALRDRRNIGREVAEESKRHP
jgi:hypothetical protein